MARVDHGRRVPGLPALILSALLALPAFAAYRRFGKIGVEYGAAWVAGISVFTFFVYAGDKHSARAGERREPERMLHLLEVLGGWPGAFLAQSHLRHKSSKTSYQIVFWLIVAVHEFLAVNSILG